MENIKYHIEYYISTDNESMLFATLVEEPSATFYFDKANNKWVFTGCSLTITQEIRKLEKISKEEAIFITMGNFVEPLYEDYGFCIYEEKVKRDIVDELVNNLIDFAISHYKNGIKKEVVLNLTAKELDEAYHCDYFVLIKDNFEEFNKRKYKDIKITKKDDDYIIKIDESIFKK